MNKPLTFAGAFTLALIALCILQTGQHINPWLILAPWVLGGLESLIRMIIRYSGAEARFLEWMMRIIIKVRAWQIKKQILKK